MSDLFNTQKFPDYRDWSKEKLIARRGELAKQLKKADEAYMNVLMEHRPFEVKPQYGGDPLPFRKHREAKQTCTELKEEIQTLSNELRTGCFFTIEGIDGSGKTTQIERLEAALSALGYTVVRVREPGGTLPGEAIRGLLKAPTLSMTPRCELLLFAAARAQLCEEVITPALEAGHIVIADRFTDSTIAYQGYGRGLHKDAVKAAIAIAINDTIIDKTCWIDIPIEVSVARREARSFVDRFEQEGIEFLKKVQIGYAANAARYQNRIKRIDGAQSEDQVTADILETITPIIRSKQ